MAKSANNDRVEPPPRGSDTNLWDVGHSDSGHVCHSSQVNTHLPKFMSPIPSLEHWNRCSATRLVGEVDVHVPTVSPAQQSHSETEVHPGV